MCVALFRQDEKAPEANHLLGDMFWGKVGGHPWWPCMIAYDPFEGVYFKPPAEGSSKCMIITA